MAEEVGDDAGGRSKMIRKNSYLYFFIISLTIILSFSSSVYAVDFSCPGGQWVLISNCSRTSWPGQYNIQSCTVGDLSYLYWIVRYGTITGYPPSAEVCGQFSCSGEGITTTPCREACIFLDYRTTDYIYKLEVYRWQCPAVCTNGETRSCYSGAAGTENVGICKAGTKTCTSGQWGECKNEVPPETEVCDGKDNDCDGQTDEDCCEDKDGDGHYAKSSTCPQGDDCNDSDATIYPGAPEVCDGKDNDCDEEVDEIFKITSLSGINTTINPFTGGEIQLIGEIDNGTNSPTLWDLSINKDPSEYVNGFNEKGNSVSVRWDGKYAYPKDKVVGSGSYTAKLFAHTEDNKCNDSKEVYFKVEQSETSCSLEITFGSSASVASGNLYHSQTLFAIPNSKILGDFTLSYNSLDGYSGPLGIGWTHTYNINLKENNDGSYSVMEGDGKRGVLYQNGSTYTPKTLAYPILVKNADGTFTLTHKDGTIYNFNSGGKVTSITDRNSNTLTFSYDSNKNLTSITDPSGRVISLGYDLNNRINTITDPNSNTHSFTYTNDTLTGISTKSYELIAKSWSYTYDPNAFMLTKTDPMGYTTTYTYDENHRVLTGTDSEGKVKSITYPSQSTDTIKTTTVTEKDGGNWTYKYDTSTGTLNEKADPEGNTTTYSYDSNKNMTSVTDPNGSVTSYTYDSERNMTSVTDAEGNATNYTYNAYGQVTGITDSEGKVTTYEYDGKGNLTSSTDSGGSTTQYQYDSKGNVTSITNADNQTTTFTYDEHSYLSSITDSTGATTTFTYDSISNMTSQTDTSGNTTTYTYDSFNRLKGITDSQGNESTFTYDLNGNRTSSIDTNGNTTYYEYNSKGQITKVTDALGNITTYTYGNTGCSSCSGGGSTGSPDKLTSITDAGGNKTSYEYDLNGRLIKETDPEGKTITYGYDSNGNLISKTTADSVSISYLYDSLNRLIELQTPNSELITYSYDSTGKVISISNQSGTTEYSYDNSNRLVTETITIDGIDYVTSYTYTDGGKLASITYPSGRTITFSLDANGRISGVTETKDNKANDIITGISYNTNGTVASISYGNGIQTTKDYDNLGRLASLLTLNSQLSTLNSYTYTRDNVGNITAITDALDSSKTKTFAYDALYRLTQAVGQWGTIQYQYDPVGNRTAETTNEGTTSYSYSANKLTSSIGVKNYSFGYDSNGNTITENSRQYTYNQNQRLIKVTDTYTDTVLGEYTYNANGQRVKKVVDGRTTYFIYDQSGNLIEEADENGNINSDYIYLGSVPIARVDEYWEGMKTPEAPANTAITPGDTQLTVSWSANDEPVDGYKIHWGTESGNYTESADVGDTTSYTITGLTNGTTYYIAIKAYADIKRTLYYHTDHLGTPILMTDKDGNKVWEGEFLPFGEEYLITGSVTNNLRFPGQYYDGETGLHYNWHRDYKPELGRYVERDPIGFKGGINPYNYTNNPVNWTDPFGLYDCTYDVSDHTMTCTPNNSGNPTFSSSDYVSGNNLDPDCCDCQDNPNRDDVAFHGPIPDGDYTIEAQRTNSSRRDLTPAPTNEMHGRSGFQIHGCSNRNTCSQGCIAATTNTTRDEFNRLMSLEEGNNTLLVEP
jgi:RHS repeat-associated protein